MSDLNMAIKMKPASADSYAARASAHLRMRQLDLALTDSAEAIRRKTRWLAIAFHVRAQVRLSKGDVTSAIEDYTESLKHQAEGVECLVGRALAWLEKGDTENAFVDCQRAIALSPDYAPAYQNLGWTLISLRRYREALNSFEKALSIEPNNSVYRESIAWLLASCPDADVRDGDRAVKYAQELKWGGGTSELQWLNLMAASAAEAGKFDEAIVLQQAAIQLAPDPKTSERAALAPSWKGRRGTSYPMCERDSKYQKNDPQGSVLIPISNTYARKALDPSGLEVRMYIRPVNVPGTDITVRGDVAIVVGGPPFYQIGSSGF